MKLPYSKLKNYLKGSFMILFLLLLIQTANAQDQILEGSVTDEIENQTQSMAEAAKINPSAEVGPIMETVIKAFLSMMGIVFLVLLVVAGFHWMMADGDDKKVGDAKNSIKTAIIGLAVMVTAYAITAFVFENLDKINQ